MPCVSISRHRLLHSSRLAAISRNALAPISFALGPAGGAPQKTWPVQLGVPLANGLWRIALSLKPPLPSGNLEIQVLRNGLLLHDDCLTQFTSR